MCDPRTPAEPQEPLPAGLPSHQQKLWPGLGSGLALRLLLAMGLWLRLLLAMGLDEGRREGVTSLREAEGEGLGDS